MYAKKLKALILALGLLQVVGTVTNTKSEHCFDKNISLPMHGVYNMDMCVLVCPELTGKTTIRRKIKNLKLQTVPPPIC